MTSTAAPDASAPADPTVPQARSHAGLQAGYSRGVLLMVGSATCFGLSVVFAKESYRAGTTVSAMLSWRFIMAAAMLWVVIAIRRPPRPTGRALLICVGLGVFGYAAQSGFYFTSLSRMDASVAALLLYTYPALVTAIALTLRRERPEARKLTALACSGVGLVLLLAAGGGSLQAAPAGVLFALGAAVTYSIYITVSITLPAGTDLFWMTAVVCTGAAASVTASTIVRGATMDIPSHAWIWVGALALISTVGGILLFFAGLPLVGASAAAILSCVEPVVAALVGITLYSEHLTPGQLLGGAGVLAGVVILQTRTRRRATIA